MYQRLVSFCEENEARIEQPVVVAGFRTYESAAPSRLIFRWGFRTVVKLVCGDLGVQDSQCGFKCYTRRSARLLAGLQRMNGFSFDVEHLYLARRLGLKVVEVPVRWVDAPGTKVRAVRDSWRMFRDLLRIRRLHRRVNGTHCVAGGTP